MVLPQVEDGLIKIMFCWNRYYINDCITPSFLFKNLSGGECP